MFYFLMYIASVWICMICVFIYAIKTQDTISLGDLLAVIIIGIFWPITIPHFIVDSYKDVVVWRKNK